MVSLEKLECPSCGANLKIRENGRVAYCLHCGEQLLISTHEKAQDTGKQGQGKLKDKKFRDKNRDAFQRDVLRTKNFLKYFKIVPIFLWIISFFLAEPDLTLLGVGLFIAYRVLKKKNIQDENLLLGNIRFPSFKYKNAFALEQKLLHLGFENIRMQNSGSFVSGFLYKNGTIDKVYINGNNAVAGKWIPMNSNILIMYHKK